MSDYLDRSRTHWTRAQDYPLNKETHYLGHAEANEFDAAKGEHVLEYGCGGGADAMSLARRGAIVSVVDIVASNVQTTLARIDSAGLGGQVDRHAELTGSASIPFASGSFDRVHTTGVLHHIVEPLPVLLEFHRLLKPRGKLTVMVYTEFLEARLETLIVGMMGATPGLTRSEAFGSFTDGHGAPHTRSYTVEQGEILLEEAGFKLLSTSEYNDRDFRTFRAVKA